MPRLTRWVPTARRRRINPRAARLSVTFLTVARLLGHADAQMVMRRYAHVRPGVLSAAAELSGNLIAATVAKVNKERAQQVKR